MRCRSVLQLRCRPKGSLASLATVALAVLALVAVVAELATFPDVDIVESIVFDTLPVSPVVISVPFVFGRVYVLVVAVLMLLASNVAFFALSASSWIAKVVSVTVLLVRI